MDESVCGGDVGDGGVGGRVREKASKSPSDCTSMRSSQPLLNGCLGSLLLSTS